MFTAFFLSSSILAIFQSFLSDIVLIKVYPRQSLTQSQPCWNLTYVSFGWRKYLLNTGAEVDAYVVDGLVFDVKVNLDIDIDFDVDFDVIEVMWDFEDDIESHSRWRHPRKVQLANKCFEYLNSFGLKTTQHMQKAILKIVKHVQCNVWKLDMLNLQTPIYY